MSVHVEGLIREEVSHHNLAANKSLEGQCSEHVEAEAQTGNVDHGVVRGEVVQHISKCLVAKGEKSTESHDQTSEHGDGGRVVGDAGEVVDSRGFEGSVDEEGIVVADKSFTG